MSDTTETQASPSAFEGTEVTDVRWKQLAYEAHRRGMAELEPFLSAFLQYCRAQGWSDPDALSQVLNLEDPVLHRSLISSELPPSVPDGLRALWRAFVQQWPIRQRLPIARPDTFQPGEWVIFVDRKGRTYLTQLQPGAKFTFHQGAVSCDDVIGQREGLLVYSNKGHPLLVFRPTLRDYLLHMPRHAQVVYPKDSAVMIMWADLYPGARVLEAGLGSGALAMVILRAIGPMGRLVSYEIRAEFIRRAQRNIQRWLGYRPENHEVRNEDIRQARLDPGSFDRAFLDLPTPTDGLPVATAALRPGGILVSISPTVPQIEETVAWLRASNLYARIEVMEVLLRLWNVRGHSVRPAHRMVAHTAFIVVAHRILPGQTFEDDTYI